MEKGQKPKRVEELEHFPFKNFDELKKRINEGIANLGVDRGVARQWIQNGIHSTDWQRAHALFFYSLNFIVPISLIVYIVVTKTWLLFLALPLLLIGFFIFHPGAMLLGPIRSGLILLTFGGLIWGFINGIGWLTALTLSLAIIWYTHREIYRKAVDGLVHAAMQHEDLLCLLWSSNALNVTMYNGDNYWFMWKTEDGKSTHYDTGNVYDK